MPCRGGIDTDLLDPAPRVVRQPVLVERSFGQGDQVAFGDGALRGDGVVLVRRQSCHDSGGEFARGLEVGIGLARQIVQLSDVLAQTLGSVALIGSLAAFGLGGAAVGWALALGVAGLQGVLAVTGYCLGCRLYFLRWWVPAAATSLWSREAREPAIESVAIRYR